MMIHGSTKTVLLVLCLSAIALFGMALPSNAYSLYDNAIRHNQNGLVYLNRGEIQLAIEEFQTAIILNPASGMSASVYNNLGIAYREHKQFALALASFQHAFRIQPNYELYYKNLIDIYERTNQLETVKNELKGILTHYPQNPEALYLLGLVHESLGEKTAAHASFRYFLELKPHAGLATSVKKHLSF